MILTQFRNKLILRGTIYALILGTLVASYSFLVSIETETDQKHKWLKNDINSLRSKINNLDEQKVELANAVEIWKVLTEEQKALSGIQITQAEQVLQKLYKEFFLDNVSTTFSKPALLDVKDMQKNMVEVEVSDNNVMSFSAYSDNQVYGFIAALQNEFPGYVKITELKINRLELPSPSALRLISEGKVPMLVQVNIGFTWYALKKPNEQENQGDEVSQ